MLILIRGAAAAFGQKAANIEGVSRVKQSSPKPTNYFHMPGLCAEAETLGRIWQLVEVDGDDTWAHCRGV